MVKKLWRFVLNTLGPKSVINHMPKGYDQHPRPFHQGVTLGGTNRKLR